MMNESTCSWHSGTGLVMWFGCHGGEVQPFQNNMLLGHLFDFAFGNHYMIYNIGIWQLLMVAMLPSCVIM